MFIFVTKIGSLLYKALWKTKQHKQMAMPNEAAHYSDVIMGAMGSHITSLTIVYPTVYSGVDQRKHQSSVSLSFVTGEVPAQMASHAENVSIWWRHHVSIGYSIQ